MRISELIEVLQNYLDKHGDYPVYLAGRGLLTETRRVSCNFVLFTEETQCKCDWCEAKRCAGA